MTSRPYGLRRGAQQHEDANSGRSLVNGMLMNPCKEYMLKDSRHELVEGLRKITQELQQYNLHRMFPWCIIP